MHSLNESAPSFRSWRQRLFFCVAGVIALACGLRLSGAQAELIWTQKTVELQANAKANVIEARYHFTNNGDTPVDIRQVQTTCGCTTASLEQRHYEPGQSGEIVARFTVGDRVGLQKKNILVTASDGPVPTTLTLTIHIPELVRVQPAFVVWKQGEPNAAKIIQVEAGQDESILTDVSVLSSNTVVSAKLQPIVEGRKYQIAVTPDATDKPLFVTLTIQCRIGSEEKTYRAYVSVPVPMPSSKLPSKEAGSQNAASTTAKPLAPMP